MNCAMSRGKRIRIMLFLLGAPATLASDRVISACDAISQRDVLRDKLVAVRGFQIATDEGTWLEGSNCEPVVTNGFVWRSSIWLELSDDWRSTAGVATGQLATSTRHINAQLAKWHFDPKRDRLSLTYIGVLKTFDDLGKQVIRDGASSRGNGY